MMETDKKYEYEVAFSFLQEDERLAYEISDLIQDRYTTFIYSEKQAEVAGTDGEKTFNEVFCNKARIVVVLFREGWGKTKWTGIEETAIRSRAFEEGYDFTIFVQLDAASKVPMWLPRTRIYYSFQRWGVKGLAPVIEAKIQEYGGQEHIETLEDQAARISRLVQREQERKVYLNSLEYQSDARSEFNKLYELLDQKTKALENPSGELNFGYEKLVGNMFTVRCENYSTYFSFLYPNTYTVNDPYLCISLAFYDKNDPKAYAERQMYGKRGGKKIITQVEYSFDVNPVTMEKGWTKKSNSSDFYTSEQVMNDWLQLFLEKVKKAKLAQFKKR